MKNQTIPLVVLITLIGQVVHGQNTAYGTGAGNSGSVNSSFGYYAGNVITGTGNVYVGAFSGYLDDDADYNTYVGAYSGRYSTAGTANTFLGYAAGYYDTSGIYNTYVGQLAGTYNRTGQQCSFFGRAAGYSTLDYDLDYMSAFGYYAGYNSQGDASSLFGYGTGYYCDGGYNSLFGTLSGYSMDGSSNTCYGYASGYNTSGSYNLLLGRYAGYGQTLSNSLIIENSSTTSPLIYGDFSDNELSINTSSTGYTLNINGTAAASSYYISSDKRFKDNVTSIDNALDLLNNINGYTYTFKDGLGLPEKSVKLNEVTENTASEELEGGSGEMPSIEQTALDENDGIRVFPEGTQYGMIAQEIQEILPELVAEDNAGYMSINYDGFVPILIQAVKEVSAEKESLETELSELSAQYEVLLSEVNKLKALLGTVSLSELKEASSSASGETETATLRNYPNPFDASTTIEYSIPNGTTAKLIITSIQGKVVEVVEALTQSGTIDLDASTLSSGTYVYALYADGEQLASNTMIIQ